MILQGRLVPKTIVLFLHIKSENYYRNMLAVPNKRACAKYTGSLLIQYGLDYFINNIFLVMVEFVVRSL